MLENDQSQNCMEKSAAQNSSQKCAAQNSTIYAAQNSKWKCGASKLYYNICTNTRSGKALGTYGAQGGTDIHTVPILWTKHTQYWWAMLKFNNDPRKKIK